MIFGGAKTFGAVPNASGGGVVQILSGVRTLPPRKSVPVSPHPMINYGMRVLECLQGRTQDFFTRGAVRSICRKKSQISEE